MDALPKAPVNMVFFFFFPLSSGKWVLKEVAITAQFHSQAIAGLGGQETAGKRCSAHSPGAEDVSLGRQMLQMETLHTWGWKISGP